MKLFVNTWVKFVGILWLVISVAMIVGLACWGNGTLDVSTPLGLLGVIGMSFVYAVLLGLCPIPGLLITFIVWANLREIK